MNGYRVDAAPLYFKGNGHFGGLTSTQLKIAALTLMFADHLSFMLFGSEMTPLRWVARLAFPIFAFMIAEGSLRTHSITKYMLNLFIFALISEIPFDLLTSGKVFFTGYQNVFFTLLFGLIAVYFTELAFHANKNYLAVIPVAASCLGADLMSSDYGAAGVLSIVLFRFFLGCSVPVKIAGFIAACFLPVFSLSINGIDFYSTELPALLAAIPILLYNGTRGKKINKYFFYAFYPSHLLLLWLAAKIIRRFL